jgi:hypothetical protein
MMSAMMFSLVLVAVPCECQQAQWEASHSGRANIPILSLRDDAGRLISDHSRTSGGHATAVEKEGRRRLNNLSVDSVFHAA